ncbi:MAG: UvrD-helicase domain-containing protein [Chloroflexi bacterium]|nr:UvrD-helicase domain-containing protein [Chloroflexota bacterium]
MEFRIADTFTDSLARLNGDEQKAVKMTAFDLQLNPALPSLSFHKLEHAKDKNFWSVRVSGDLRLIVHKTGQSLLLCYVDHHDKAYGWAERRKLETHPKTGAAQLIEIRERIEEIAIPKYIEVAQPAPKARAKPALFARVSDEDLLSYGVPPEWLADVRAATEDSLLALADHLPAEAAEALLELATNGKPKPITSAAVTHDPFQHPDALRRFRLMKDVDELQRALDYPWEKWTLFLHPAQRQWVERDYNGPARVSGSAGTGKTIVALHRAVFLARQHPDARVLLTTFSDTLASALQQKLRRLISNEPRLADRLEVMAMDTVAERLYTARFGRPKFVSPEVIKQQLALAAASAPTLKLSLSFVLAEWETLVDPWQLSTWEAYRDAKRLGRKTRLPEPQRVALWSIFSALQAYLLANKLVTRNSMLAKLATQIAGQPHPPFEFVIVDESQDIGVAQLRFLAAFGANQPNRLFFAGDLGQRIFQQPFSWKSVGVDVRGRSRTLHINYRTSHQIRSQADQLLGPEVSDIDGLIEERRGTVSVFNGPDPLVQSFATAAAEEHAVADWLQRLSQTGVKPGEIGVFVRSSAELPRARNALLKAGLAFKVLDEHIETIIGQVSICSMHLAKGLEFRTVVVMACDDEVIPLQARIESVTDEADLEEIYNTERHLLYVACTRARDHLLITSTQPASEFLGDLQGR